MSTARELLLEIKRQTGSSNVPVPDETDSLAFLNRALSGLWNYGARLNSPVLYKDARFTSATGSVAVSDGIMRIKNVRDHGDSGTQFFELPLDRAAAFTSTDNRLRAYVVYPARIDVFPLSVATDIDMVYMPVFTRLTSRSDISPFSAELDDVTVEMAIKLMSGASAEEVLAVKQYGNSVSRFFRGRGPNAPSGCGPW